MPGPSLHAGGYRHATLFCGGESADGGAYLQDQTTAMMSATLLLLATRWRVGSDHDPTALEGRKKFHGKGRRTASKPQLAKAERGVVR